MKTDTIFYSLFQTFPQILFELIDQPLIPAETYQFSSVEVKQLAFRIDGVFLPQDPQSPIYFIEVQFQSDSQFYSRFFSEILLYLDKSELKNDWRGVVIFFNRSLEPKNTIRYHELLDSDRVIRIYLDELETSPEISLAVSLVKLIIIPENQAIESGKQIIERIRVGIEDEQQQKKLLQLIETVLIYKLPQAKRQEIEAMFSLSDLKQTKVYQEALEEGRQEGQEEGKQLGKLEAVSFMISLGASVEQIAEALDLEIEQVRKAANLS